MEYNNTEKHNDLVHDIAVCQGAHPSKFVPIFWSHSKQTLSTVIWEYKRAFKNWKISGYHGGFDDKVEESQLEPQPFCNFVGGINSLLYLHKFVYQFPNVLSKVFGEFPKWAFRESIRNANTTADTKPKPFKQEKKRWAPRFNPSEAALNQFNASMDKKNQRFQYGLLTDTSMKLESNLTKQRALQRELLKD